MPGFDRTGPRGMGPRTGRGLGFCPPGAGPVGYYGPEVVRGVGRGGIPWGGGRGRAWGGGRGMGWAYGGYPYNVPPYWAYGPRYEPGPEQELQALQNQASFLEQQLQKIRERIGELEGKEANTE